MKLEKTIKNSIYRRKLFISDKAGPELLQLVSKIANKLILPTPLSTTNQHIAAHFAF